MAAIGYKKLCVMLSMRLKLEYLLFCGIVPIITVISPSLVEGHCHKTSQHLCGGERCPDADSFHKIGILGGRNFVWNSTDDDKIKESIRVMSPLKSENGTKEGVMQASAMVGKRKTDHPLGFGHDVTNQTNSKGKTSFVRKIDEIRKVYENIHSIENKYVNGSLFNLGITGAKTIKHLIEDRENIALGIIFITISFAVVVLLISGVIEKRVEDAKDQFLKNTYDTCFKQIALVCLVNLVLWLILQTRISYSIDSIIISRHEMENIKMGAKSPTESTFERILCISIIFLAWYIAYIIYFQYVVRRLLIWMKNVDTSDVLTTLKELEFLEGRCFSALFNRDVINKAKFLANRYDFIENINCMDKSGIDPCGYYFMEYLRASVLKVSVDMFKLPPEALILVFILSIIFRQAFAFEKEKEIVLICAFTIVCTVSLFLVAIHVFRIESKMYPEMLSQYLLLRYNTNEVNMTRGIDCKMFPAYKTTIPTKPGTSLWGFANDGEFNNHENLFMFKSRGPRLLMKCFEVLVYCFLITLSLWIYLSQQHKEYWQNPRSYGNSIICFNILLVALLIPNILYSIVVITKTGMMIDMETLECVWQSHKSNNMRRATELIDALNVDAVTMSISKDGEAEMRQLLAKLRTSPLGVQKQLHSMWSSLDRKQTGCITMPKVLQFIYSQGIPATLRKVAERFAGVFMRKYPNKLTQDEFLILGLVVKNIIIFPIETPKMKFLFEEVYGIPWNSPCGVDLDSLKRILQHLGIVWGDGALRHLLCFLGGGKLSGMSAENFVEQLRSVEQFFQSTGFQNSLSEV